ncbi:XRE family transcriptional regulator [Pedobacter chinensis]|uniref:XRE family transcriptional regulator n=1 Tax=Pedobacter chinensis TaxID=2282421 RepID=A0A369PYK0_9SPHI|nr:helix-turn-helix transcriptional regulator [Pedobacter chinensis]RDC55816.1 XRE family transcriptional regulator [Pedobacter chinensis]
MNLINSDFFLFCGVTKKNDPMLGIEKKIRTLRQAKGWSQGEVSEKIGLSTAAFSKIEKGVTDVSISRLQQLAELFDVQLSELILPVEQLSKDHQESLKEANDTINAQLNKIVELQEYIISLYEQLHKVKAEVASQ